MRALCLSLILFSISCTRNENDWTPTKFSSGSIESTDKDVKIPKSLLIEFEKAYIDQMHKMHIGSTKKDIDWLLEVPLHFFQLSVFLKEAKKGVLEGDYLFSFVKGGGTVDLAKHMGDKRGAFWLHMDLGLPPNVSDSKLQVYFLNETRPRRIGDESLGLSCGKILNVSKFFKEKIVKKSLKLYTAELRYLNIIGGTFYLILPHENQLYLSSLSFRDTRYSELDCPARAGL